MFQSLRIALNTKNDTVITTKISLHISMCSSTICLIINSPSISFLFLGFLLFFTVIFPGSVFQLSHLFHNDFYLLIFLF